MNAPTIANRPIPPYTCIVVVNEPNDDGGYSHVRFIEVAAFDARDAWMGAEDACDLGPNANCSAYIQGVVGPGGWTERPDWIDPYLMLTPEEANERADTYWRTQKDGHAFA